MDLRGNRAGGLTWLQVEEALNKMQGQSPRKESQGTMPNDIVLQAERHEAVESLRGAWRMKRRRSCAIRCRSEVAGSGEMMCSYFGYMFGVLILNLPWQ